MDRQSYYCPFCLGKGDLTEVYEEVRCPKCGNIFGGVMKKMTKPEMLLEVDRCTKMAESIIEQWNAILQRLKAIVE